MLMLNVNILIKNQPPSTTPPPFRPTSSPFKLIGSMKFLDRVGELLHICYNHLLKQLETSIIHSKFFFLLGVGRHTQKKCEWSNH